MIQVVAVGGMPASGKTTLFRKLLKRTGGAFDWLRLKEKLIVYQDNSELKTIVLGDYEDSAGLFAGTDRLSMAVQTQIGEALDRWDKCSIKHVLLEGDRLYNHSFFETVADLGLKLKIYELIVSDKVAKQRHLARKDSQKEAWLKGRETKLANLRREYGVIPLPNETEKDLENNVLLFKGLIDKMGVYP